MPSYSSQLLSLRSLPSPFDPPPLRTRFSTRRVPATHRPPPLALIRVHRPSAFESPFEAAFDYNQSPRALRP